MTFESQFQLDGKVALVTGGSKGIGKAIAFFLAKAGAKVVISSRKQAELDEVVSVFRSEQLDVQGVAANVGDTTQLQHLVEETIRLYGGIDILVNNAAANPVFGPVENTDERAYDKIMGVNVKGPFELSKLVLPSMQSRQGGCILNISSIGGLKPESQLGIYSMSKAALISLTKVLAREWGAYGIRVNAICPGLIHTQFSEALWNNEKILKYLMAQLPLKRVGTVEEIASLALFLSSPAASYCTGAVFTADGGYTI